MSERGNNFDPVSGDRIMIYGKALEELKALRHTERQIGSLKASIKGHRKELQRLTHKRREIRQHLLDLVGMNGIYVSDHAVIRYLERVKGVDMDALRDEIWDGSEELKSQLNANGHAGRFRRDGFVGRVSDGVVITVVTDGIDDE